MEARKSGASGMAEIATTDGDGELGKKAQKKLLNRLRRKELKAKHVLETHEHIQTLDTVTGVGFLLFTFISTTELGLSWHQMTKLKLNY